MSLRDKAINAYRHSKNLKQALEEVVWTDLEKTLGSKLKNTLDITEGLTFTRSERYVIRLVFARIDELPEIMFATHDDILYVFGAGYMSEVNEDRWDIVGEALAIAQQNSSKNTHNELYNNVLSMLSRKR